MSSIVLVVVGAAIIVAVIAIFLTSWLQRRWVPKSRVQKLEVIKEVDTKNKSMVDPTPIGPVPTNKELCDVFCGTLSDLEAIRRSKNLMGHSDTDWTDIEDSLTLESILHTLLKGEHQTGFKLRSRKFIHLLRTEYSVFGSPYLSSENLSKKFERLAVRGGVIGVLPIKGDVIWDERGNGVRLNSTNILIVSRYSLKETILEKSK